MPTPQLRDHVGQRVLLRGWLHHRRDLANVTFAILRDGSGTAQVSVPRVRTHTLDGITAESANPRCHRGEPQLTVTVPAGNVRPVRGPPAIVVKPEWR